MKMLMLAGALCLGGCCGATNVRDEQPARPALVSSVSEAGTKEIRSILAAETGQTSPIIGSDVFTKFTIVALSKKDYSGRVLDMPLRFRLLKQGEQCILENMQSQKQWVLKTVQCVTE